DQGKASRADPETTARSLDLCASQARCRGSHRVPFRGAERNRAHGSSTDPGRSLRSLSRPEGRGGTHRSHRARRRALNDAQDMIGAVLAATIVLGTASPTPRLATTAGVPVSCVDNSSWTTDFPSSVGSAMGLYDTLGHAIFLRAIICDRLAL